jgi:triosephosphate isomerase
MVQINRGAVKPPRRTPIIAGNWKMNKSVEEALALVDEMVDDLDAFEEVEVVLAPPFMSLYPVLELVEDTAVKLAAQTMFYQESGAYTGEISPLMVRELCDYVIIGHSERRRYFHETDEDVNLKVKAAIRHDLTPILAIGEDLLQREAGETHFVITSQLRTALNGVNADDATGLVIAYEPLWAIGSGQPATGETAQEVAALIRQTLGELFGSGVAAQVRIQYGGSVTAANIAEFIGQPDIDGALVGGASLKATDFVSIVARTQEVSLKK